jgi:membrane protease YdiL (CAAX protease family)
MSAACATMLGGWVGRLVLSAPGARAAFEYEGLPGLWGLGLKALTPVGGYLLAGPILWLLFRNTWRQLDAEAAEHRQAQQANGSYDYRPLAMCAIAALILTMQEYYGGRGFFYAVLRPWLRDRELSYALTGHGIGRWLHIDLYSELYSFGWWSATRFLGYVVVPLTVWKLAFRKDSVIDMAGLRVRGLLKHAWIYGACLLVVIPLVFVVSRSPEFANYYPFYKDCSRSWVEFLSWEAMYVLQFFALEIYFRGFWVQGLRRTLGSGAIFVMCVPYVMIHYGKPYLESCGALIAGVALGSLAARTKSIYSGFGVHITVALLMDVLGVRQGGGLPTSWWPQP